MAFYSLFNKKVIFKSHANKIVYVDKFSKTRKIMIKKSGYGDILEHMGQSTVIIQMNASSN